MTSTTAASPNIYRTTNGGVNWNINLPGEYFWDMFFTDSLTGWKCMPGYIAGDSCVKKTTNGGINWIKQILPSGGLILAPVIGKFSHIGADTIWGVGSEVFYGSGQFRGIIYRTFNGGNNWYFQVPDTTIHIGSYSFVQFTDSKKGWAYSLSQGGIHTLTGGDTIWLTGIKPVSSKILNKYVLYQNYPNPFNPKTNIKYQITNTGYVKLKVYDILGRDIFTIVNRKQAAGTFQIDFSGISLYSGIYFYSLFVNDQLIDTKKMILIK